MLVLCELGGLGDETPPPTPTMQTLPLDVSTSNSVVDMPTLLFIGGGGGVVPVLGSESSQDRRTLELPSGLSLER
jgi:hypothetical protein